MPINGASVAYALKIPVGEANERLEDLVVRDVLIREVDSRGAVFFQLPGRPAAPPPPPATPSSALAPRVQPSPLLYNPPPPGSPTSTPSESDALAGLLINVLFFPGLGSLIAGKTNPGIYQLLLFVVGIPLCFVVVGFPMIVGAWVWGLVTGVKMINEGKQKAQSR